MDYYKLIFLEYKDSHVSCSSHLYKLIGKLAEKVDYHKIYRDIINYQIEKYGSVL